MLILLSIAEAKFKSHNKIVCHREAINGGGFITDAGRVRLWQILQLKGKRMISRVL